MTEIITAKYIIYPYNEVRCSICNYPVWGSELNTYKDWNYCPNCGSRIKEEEHD